MVIGLSGAVLAVQFRVITKSDDHVAGGRFVYHEYDYRPNWTIRCPIESYQFQFPTNKVKVSFEEELLIVIFKYRN